MHNYSSKLPTPKVASHTLWKCGVKGKNVSHLLISVLWQEHLSPQFCLAEQPPRSHRQKRGEHLLEVIRCCQDHQARCRFYWESSLQGKEARGGTLAGQTSRRRHLFLCASPAERAGPTAASNPNPLLVFVWLPKRVTCFKLVTSGLVCNGNHYLNRKHISKHHFCSSYCS